MGNKGVNFCEHAHAAGHTAKLLFAPLQQKRCRLSDFYGLGRLVPRWAKEYDRSHCKELVEAVVEQAQGVDAVLATGAFEAVQLIKNKIPFHWFVSGGEISESPFGDNQESLAYRRILTSGKQYIKSILSNHNDVKFAARILGLSDKIIPICDVPYILPVFRGAQEGSFNHPTIGSYTRRVYSGAGIHSKGTEHIVDYLRLVKESGLDEIYQHRLTADGPHADRFFQEVNSIGLRNLIWLGSLTRFELASELSSVRPIILDQFGEREQVLSGIIREGIAFGCPVLCDNIYCEGFASNLTYPVPVLRAISSYGISNWVFKLQSSKDSLDELSQDCESYAQKNFHSGNFVSALVGQIFKA